MSNMVAGNVLAIIYNNFGPYHLARLEAVTRMGKKRGFEVVGLELASQENLYPWSVDAIALELKKLTIFSQVAMEEVDPWTLARGTWSMLQQLNPRAIAFGSNKQAFPALLSLLTWAWLHQRVAILMMDSKYDDAPRGLIKEWLKKQIISRFDAALVGGTYSRHYAELLGIAPEHIRVGCDVVDNDYFARQADAARKNAALIRQQHGLPENYFLYVGRFDEKKNVSRLLQAYGQYLKTLPMDQAWRLVLCGSGPLEDRLRQEARQLGLAQVIFAGFKQIDELPIYYGLARCLILHSLGDTWGLVVNEAMAAGLPVLVSKACGCTPDLVQEGVNGYTYNPYDVEELARLMLEISSGRVDLAAMGEASRNIIVHWSPETFAGNLMQAVERGMRR